MNFIQRITLLLVLSGLFSGLVDADPYVGDGVLAALALLCVCVIVTWVVVGTIEPLWNSNYDLVADR